MRTVVATDVFHTQPNVAIGRESNEGRFMALSGRGSFSIARSLRVSAFLAPRNAPGTGQVRHRKTGREKSGSLHAHILRRSPLDETSIPVLFFQTRQRLCGPAG